MNDCTIQPASDAVPSLSTDFVLPDLIPVRMVNEFAYCPRLAYLEWVQSEFEESADTVEGRLRHRRVDAEKGDLPSPDEVEEAEEKLHASSVLLSGSDIGLIARIDLIEIADGLVSPVDYKRGRVPDIPESAYEPERVQLGAQALILRENGYRCETGVLYFVGSKRRVEILIDEPLIDRTRELIGTMKEVAASGRIPPPLVDSPKCPRCSLVGICLPDETHFLSHPDEVHREPVRRLIPGRDDALPLAIQTQGAYVGKKGDSIEIKVEGKAVAEARLHDVSQVLLYGFVQISTACVRELMGVGIPVLYFSSGNWFYGYTSGLAHKNIERRIVQFRSADSPDLCLRIAKRLVRDKVQNCRTLLRRNIPDCAPEPLAQLKREVEAIESCSTLESLLGHEGNAGRVYFAAFSGMLKPAGSDLGTFDFRTRNRRPPLDPVNALLSFFYSLLVKDLMVTLTGVGFDPLLGFYHQPRYGRPALALDLMEPFRPLIADSAAIGAINNGVFRAEDFVRVGSSCSLTGPGRKKAILAYERRMDDLVTHPVFDYRVSYRRILEVQSRLLARFLEGEVSDPPAFVTR